MKEILKDKLLFVFDLDGTLVDSIGVWDEIDIKALKQCGITPRVTLPKERANFLHSCTDENIYEKYEEYLYGSYDISIPFDEYKKLKVPIRKKFISNNVTLINGADKILPFLKSNGYMLALATSSDRASYETYLHDNPNIFSHLNFDEYFEKNVFTQEDVVLKKPDPEVHFKISSTLGIPREKIVIVEDSKTGVTAAKNANIDCICISEAHSISDKKFLTENSMLYLNSFNELISIMS